MGILSKIRQWFAPQSSELRAKVDAAQTTPMNSQHWAHTDALSADAAYSHGVRKRVRERARYEVLNNGIARGIVRTHANAVIGTGPRLQVLLKSEKLCADIEVRWSTWCRSRRFVDKLRTLRMSQCVDGEAFALLTTGSPVGGVELDVTPIECDQVTDGAGLQFGIYGYNPDGIELDDAGNVSRYHVLRHHPGENFRPVEMVSDRIAASQVVHLFRAERPNQHRGLSELTPALGLFAILRRYTMATLTSAETAASIAGILRTNSTAIDPAEVDPWEEIAIRHGAMITLPDGWSMEQFRAENPQAGYESFKRAIISEIARCLNMPYNVAAADSSGHNYSSGRLDHQVYGKEVQVDQDYYERACLDRVFSAWLDEAVLEGELPVSALDAAVDHEWHWDPLEDIDPQKTASARQTNLSTGMTSYATEFAIDGRDWRTEFEKQAECLGMTFDEYQAALRLQHFPPVQMPAAPAGSADAGGTDSAASDSATPPEFGGLSRLQWQRNRKAIRDVLDGLIAGTETPASAQLFLESIGLSSDRAKTLISDAQDNAQIDDPALADSSAQGAAQ